MNLKTVLLHLDAGAACAGRIDFAIRLAARHGAHVVALAPTGHPDAVLSIDRDAPDVIEYLATPATFLRECAEAAVAEFELRARASSLASFEARVVERDAGDALCRAARVCDLVIVGQTEPETVIVGVSRDVAEHVILQSGCPTLVVPYDGSLSGLGARVLIGWKDGREAARAVRDGLWLLAQADRVVLLEVDETHREADVTTGASVMRWLMRHGVVAEVRGEGAGADVGEALLRHAGEIGADLLVMGAYAHGRLHQWVLGGATRHVLRHMTLPTLFSH